jgi:hypothetical protein
MLQRRRRVTYSTLRLQFQLDNEQLAALKDELLYSQPHVVDDAGRGLVWTGDTDTTPDRSLSPLLPVPAESPPGRTVQGAPAPVTPRPVDADVASEEVKPGIILDFNAQDQVVAIEILKVQEHTTLANLNQIQFEVAS